MAVEVEKLYSNLNKLLIDICNFLTTEANYETLSPQARKEADALINRSKTQLQEIQKVAIEGDEAYVDMEPKPVQEEPEENNVYSLVENTNPLPVVAKNPYENLPAKEMSQAYKYGILQLKYKLILNIEKFRRIYGGIHNKWLLLYNSEKDLKPFLSLNLKLFEARKIPPKNKKCISRGFEIVGMYGDGKTYSFQASTHKDMLQWVVYINKGKEESSNNIIEDDDDSNNSSIYIEIDRNSKQSVLLENKPPDLPARIIIRKNEEKNDDSHSKSSEDSNQNYDSVVSSVNQSTSSTFSYNNDDEDEIYAAFASVNKNFNIEPEDTDEIYENTSNERPKIPAKPNNLKR